MSDCLISKGQTFLPTEVHRVIPETLDLGNLTAFDINTFPENFTR